jgi:hypothetical protein
MVSVCGDHPLGGGHAIFRRGGPGVPERKLPDATNLVGVVLAVQAKPGTPDDANKR